MTSNPARSAKQTRPKDQLERPAAPERKTSEDQLAAWADGGQRAETQGRCQGDKDEEVRFSCAVTRSTPDPCEASERESESGDGP